MAESYSGGSLSSPSLSSCSPIISLYGDKLERFLGAIAQCQIGTASRPAFSYSLEDLDEGALTRNGGHLFKNADLRVQVPSPQVRGSVAVTVTDERYEMGVDLSRVSCICFRPGLKYPRNLATRGNDNAIE
jgi:hypothetical protein